MLLFSYHINSESFVPLHQKESGAKSATNWILPYILNEDGKLIEMVSE